MEASGHQDFAGFIHNEQAQVFLDVVAVRTMVQCSRRTLAQFVINSDTDLANILLATQNLHIVNYLSPSPDTEHQEGEHPWPHDSACSRAGLGLTVIHEPQGGDT